jgi:hypothetical protein
MTVWQHAWISVDPTKSDDISKLESFGKEGWEMVSVLPWGQAWQFERTVSAMGAPERGNINPSGPSVFLMFFKRPVPDSTGM